MRISLNSNGISDTTYLANTIEDIGKKKDVKDVNWGAYFWVEKTAPKGYNRDREVLDLFDIGAQEADRTSYVMIASDTRKKGKVTLTKTSK